MGKDRHNKTFGLMAEHPDKVGMREETGLELP
jgi:hypothetical protein